MLAQLNDKLGLFEIKWDGYVDHLENKRGQTVSYVYSLRTCTGCKCFYQPVMEDVKHGFTSIAASTFVILQKTLQARKFVFKSSKGEAEL